MHNSPDTTKHGFILLAIMGGAAIIILALRVGQYEATRRGVLQEHLPAYVVKETAAAATLLATRLTAQSNVSPFRSTGTSNDLYMPFNYSIIILDNTSYSDLRVHDFIGYINDNGTRVLHRLVEKTDRGWVTRGDSNLGPDITRVTPENYRGKLVEPIITWEAALIAGRHYRPHGVDSQPSKTEAAQLITSYRTHSKR